MTLRTTILLAMIVLGASTLAAQDEATGPPSLTVSGSAALEVDPDEALVDLGVEAQAPRADAAQAEVNRIAAEILRGLRELDIDEEAVQTSRLMLQPIYDYRRSTGDEGPPRVIAYRATNVVSVRLRDLSKVGPAIDAATTGGANRVEGVQFRLRDELAARQRALRQATEEARAKAEAIAGALGEELGSVLRVEEQGVSFQPVQFGQMMMARAEAKAVDTPVSPGQVTISATVGVTFRLGAR
jgi:hypothetical protein